jgi:gamma-glutamylaminecyclotransferase
MQDNELFFVYGTLMSPYNNNRLLVNEELLGTAITKNKYTMMAGGIPYVFKTPETCQIHGELWSVKESAIPNLDSLEGHPRWYKREKIEVLFNNKIVLAWLYFMQGQPDMNNDNTKLVKSGNYNIYRNNL